MAAAPFAKGVLAKKGLRLELLQKCKFDVVFEHEFMKVFHATCFARWTD